MKTGEAITRVGLAVIIFIGVSILVTLPVYLCWNYLAPTFDQPQLTMAQSWVLLVLCGLLFKGVNGANISNKKSN
jgi:hypothetical protein